MKIHVLQHHIDRGKRCGINNCPIALALKEAVNSSNCYVTPAYLGIKGNKYLNSIDVRDKIKHYDQTGKMEPFCFEVDIYDLEI